MDDENRISDSDPYSHSWEDGIDFTRINTKKLLVLNFRVLQLSRVETLQQELFDMQTRFALEGTRNALRNYEFLGRDSLQSIPSESELFGAPKGLRKCRQAPPKRAMWSLFAKPHRAPEFELTDWPQYIHEEDDRPQHMEYPYDRLNRSLEFRELDKTGREERAQAQAFIGRLSMAVFGGLSLIGPMLIMKVHPSQKTSLIVTSLATMLFAVAVAVFAKDTSGKDVLAATAAYAAVLVVFVGTSSGSKGASAAS
ncbi:hypothetical protein BDV97DRAFT_403101 [Delphinella strobiligena]|nr:hypothetical protein BDV97DRAFT_403101 [Delphinella strobiligena]